MTLNLMNHSLSSPAPKFTIEDVKILQIISQSIVVIIVGLGPRFFTTQND